MASKVSDSHSFFGRAYVFSHTHWDREWYLSQRQFQFLLGDTLDEVLDILAKDPSFPPFTADGQTLVIEDYLEVRPDRKAQLLELIRASKIRVGPWYTMPDLWLPDGESIIRNLLIGGLDCVRYGVEQPLLGYVPDSFGHIEQMPQILNGFGIDNYVFGRGAPMDDLQGALEFFWIGPDGDSRVLAHLLPDGYQNGMMLPTVSKTEQLGNSLGQALWPYQARSACPDLALICNGVDHIRLQRDLPELLKAAHQLYPQVEFQAGDLLDYVKAFAHQSPQLPERCGTLQGRHWNPSMLHGTWSSRIDNKLENARAMMTLENWAEPLATMVSAQDGGATRQDELLLAWRLLLQNHAHDSICGCSIDRVHADVNRRFTHIEELGEMIAGDALNRWNKALPFSTNPRLILFSGLAGAGGVVEFLVDRENDDPFSVFTPDGHALPVQILSCRRLLRTDVVTLRDQLLDRHDAPKAEGQEFEFFECRAVASFPEAAACSIHAYEIKEDSSSPSISDPVTVSAFSLENALLRIEVKSDGTLSIFHKPTGRLHEGLLALKDEADLGGGYMFLPLDRDVPRKSIECTARITISERGPLRGALRMEMNWPLPAALDPSMAKREDAAVDCEWRIEIRLESGSESVQIRGQFLNRVREHRVRLTLPLPFSAQAADVERAFVVAHESMDDYTADPGQHSHPMRNWVAVGDQKGGLAFVGRGLHEWSLENDNLEITLLRSVPFVYTCGSWETPEGLMLTQIDYDFALLFFSGTWREGKVAQRAARFIQPPVVETFGGASPPWSGEPHASVALQQIDSGLKRHVSSSRLVWRKHFARRDGWRRKEPTIVSTHPASLQFSPLSWDDSDILLSALKSSEAAAEGTSDWIARFYSLATTAREFTLRMGLPIEATFRTDLSEKQNQPIPLHRGQITLVIRPFEIITLRLKLASPLK